jgi:hypothetical protein
MKLTTIKRERGKESLTDRIRVPLTERIMKRAAITAVALGIPLAGSACTFDSSGIGIIDARVTETGAEASPDRGPEGSISKDVRVDVVVKDSGIDISVDQRLDLSVDKGVDSSVDKGVDSSVDKGVDSSVDKGVDSSVDKGVDSSVDSNVDIGLDSGIDGPAPQCPNTSIAQLYTATFNKGIPINVGGYAITYKGETATGGTVDIECATGGAVVESDVAVDLVSVMFIYVPANNEKIRLYMHSRGPSSAIMTVKIELP